MTSKRKVLVIGLDGATWDLIDPWMKAGHLPTFKQFVDRGTRGHLKSTIPAHTGPAWTTAFTGVNPGKHNVYGFFTIKDYEMKIVLSSDRKAKPIWSMLSEKGFKVNVINAMCFYPPDEVNGFMVGGMPGMLDKLPNIAYPAELQKRLNEIDYKVEIGFVKEKILDRVFEVIEKRKEITLELSQKIDWDLNIVVFIATDRVQHSFWNIDVDKNSVKEFESDSENKNLILNTYKKLDSVLMELTEKIGKDANTIIISDHGFGRIRKSIYLNNWLESRGLLKRMDVTEDNPVKRNSILRSIKSMARGLGKILLPRKTEKIMAERKLQRLMDRRKKDNIDWKNTKIRALPEGFLEINLIGRQPKGLIESGQQLEELKNQIKNELSNLKDPENGEKVVNQVFTREELYHGPYVKNAPDMWVKPREGYVFSPGFGKNMFEILPRITGSHRDYGIFLAFGPDIKKNSEIKDLSLLDISPTILHLLEIPIPMEMDGQVLTGIYRKDSKAAARKIELEEMSKEKKKLMSKISRIKSSAHKE